MLLLKKLLLRTSITLFLVLTLIILGLIFTGNSYIFRGIQLTYLKGEKTASIDDYLYFDNRVIKAGTPLLWEKDKNYNNISLTPKLQHSLDNDQTVAFAIIKDGKLLYEKYWQGYSSNSRTNSFSMAKSVTTMLYLKAVEDGYISSINEPIVNLLPEYASNKYAQKCTLADLSAMTSGYDWTENYYFPINPTAKSYYGNNLEQQIISRPFIKECGGHFKYSSGDSQLLGIALSRALEKHGLTISSYLQQSFWQPLGMVNDAYWSLDGSAKIEKTYCCINGSALDFAKLGQLLLNNGRWQGQQLLSSENIKFMVTPNSKAFSETEPQVYGHSIWTDMDSPVPLYGLLGHLGQRVLVLPEDNIIIVRLGKSKALPKQLEGFNLGPDIGLYVTETKKIIDGLKIHD